MITREQVHELIEFYRAIPEERWRTGQEMNPEMPKGHGCAMRHVQSCRERPRLSFIAHEVSRLGYALFHINDGSVLGAHGSVSFFHYGSTPKERVVNYLLAIAKDLKA
jgi:hypothetical protein